MSRKKMNPFGDYSSGVSVEEQSAFDALHPLISVDIERSVEPQEKELRKEEKPRKEFNWSKFREPTVEEGPFSVVEPSAHRERRTREPALTKKTPSKRRSNVPVKQEKEKEVPSYPWVPTGDLPVTPSRESTSKQKNKTTKKGQNRTIRVDETFHGHMERLCEAYGVSFTTMLKMLAAERLRQDLVSGFIKD
jgi:hypothetical protein